MKGASLHSDDSQLRMTTGVNTSGVHGRCVSHEEKGKQPAD